MSIFSVAAFGLRFKFRLPSATLHCFAALSLTIVPTPLFAQVERTVSTTKGMTTDKPVPHPLSWWTRDPLRLDADGLLLITKRANDGRIFTAQDYIVKQQVQRLGTIGGLQILQVLTDIRPGSQIIASGLASAEELPTQWKSLLVQDGGGDQYVEIYKLQAGFGLYQPLKSAQIYGVGPDSILGTYDPDSGNGGGCDDGYWWFDKAGAHAVDFSPLEQAIGRVLPPNSTHTPRCWALHPEKEELESGVQKINAECHACGGVGNIYARYKIERGKAVPVSVRFEPEKDQ